MTDVVNDRLLRMKPLDEHAPCVVHKVGLGVTTIYKLLKEGKFPEPTTIGGAKLWSEHELNLWIEKRKNERAA